MTNIIINIIIGYATFYTVASSSIVTASGDLLNEDALTCALPIRGVKFGRIMKVTNMENGKTIKVRHNDYGPGPEPIKRGVKIDLSPAAFTSIADLKQGRIKVKIEKETTK